MSPFLMIFRSDNRIIFDYQSLFLLTILHAWTNILVYQFSDGKIIYCAELLDVTMFCRMLNNYIMLDRENKLLIH